MIVVVEIAGRRGDRACKEYDAPSLDTAVRAAERELRAYPRFRITDVWIRESKTPNPVREAEEGW
jgi:hypothetical protein